MVMVRDVENRPFLIQDIYQNNTCVCLVLSGRKVIPLDYKDWNVAQEVVKKVKDFFKENRNGCYLLPPIPQGETMEQLPQYSYYTMANAVIGFFNASYIDLIVPQEEEVSNATFKNAVNGCIAIYKELQSNYKDKMLVLKQWEVIIFNLIERIMVAQRGLPPIKASVFSTYLKEFVKVANVDPLEEEIKALKAIDTSIDYDVFDNF